MINGRELGSQFRHVSRAQHSKLWRIPWIEVSISQRLSQPRSARSVSLTSSLLRAARFPPDTLRSKPVTKGDFCTASPYQRTSSDQGIGRQWASVKTVSQYHRGASDFLGNHSIFMRGSGTAATRAAQQPAFAQSASSRGHDSSGGRAGVGASASFISLNDFDVLLMSLVL